MSLERMSFDDIFVFMKLQFKNQKSQSDAAKAVTDAFVGQRNVSMQEYPFIFTITQ